MNKYFFIFFKISIDKRAEVWYHLIKVKEERPKLRKEVKIMYTIKTATIERTYKNFGNHAEQALAFTLTGEIRKHDHVAYDKGSDIPEYNMSVKSSGFSLMSARLCESEDFEEIITQYMAHTASTCVAYVAQNMVAYVMNMEQFNEFLHRFCYLNRESTQNGGGYKVKMLKESKKVLAWLDERVAA